mmetsp:Transcript_10993/g.34926  ORF Transcript_10993/g.34926 Transcript_10993/m.34926 type:complete len:308 (-) Transcript_10993:764-1687(-)
MAATSYSMGTSRCSTYNLSGFFSLKSTPSSAALFTKEQCIMLKDPRLANGSTKQLTICEAPYSPRGLESSTSTESFSRWLRSTLRAIRADVTEPRELDVRSRNLSPWLCPNMVAMNVPPSSNSPQWSRQSFARDQLEAMASATTLAPAVWMRFHERRISRMCTFSERVRATAAAPATSHPVRERSSFSRDRSYMTALAMSATPSSPSWLLERTRLLRPIPLTARARDLAPRPVSLLLERSRRISSVRRSAGMTSSSMLSLMPLLARLSSRRCRFPGSTIARVIACSMGSVILLRLRSRRRALALPWK